MPKSPLLRKVKTDEKISKENRRKQKFAIIAYYKKKNSEGKNTKK